MTSRWPCPCCGFQTLPQLNSYELCPVCFWEDDPYESERPRSADGANGVCLIDAQAEFLRIGAMDEIFLKKVRQPLERERRSEDWRPYVEQQ